MEEVLNTLDEIKKILEFKLFEFQEYSFSFYNILVVVFVIFITRLIVRAMKKTDSFSLGFDDGWMYDPAPESADHIDLKNSYDLFIDGKFCKPNSAKYFETINPSNGEVLAKIAEANEKDIDKAVKSARAAHKEWSSMSRVGSIRSI